MKISKNLKYSFYIFFFVFLILYFYFFINNLQKEKKLAKEPILINLLTNVHPDLPWSFKPTKPKIFIKPGEVVNVDYIVENLANTASTGIATFAYYPAKFESYVSKINCFCYDAQTLKAKEKNKYTLVLLIDPEVTKDSKTKSVKEVTIQFTFFDYDEYKENKS